MTRFVLLLIILIGATHHTVAQEVYVNKITVNDSISLEIGLSNFVSGNHKIQSQTEGGWNKILTIDGKIAFGTDYDLPKTKVEFIKLIIFSRILFLDCSSMYNSNGGSLLINENQFNVYVFSDDIRIHAELSDGAGYYETAWLVRGNSSIRTKIDTVD